jgi:hypothetical protein
MKLAGGHPVKLTGIRFNLVDIQPPPIVMVGAGRPSTSFVLRTVQSTEKQQKHGWSACADHDEKRGGGRREKLGNSASRTVAILGNRQPASYPDANRNLNLTAVAPAR